MISVVVGTREDLKVVKELCTEQFYSSVLNLVDETMCSSTGYYGVRHGEE